MPRRFTHPLRFVETVTSGELVTTRAASSVSLEPMSLRMRPKPLCVEISGSPGAASRSGIATGGASCTRRSACANGTVARNARNRSSGTSRPTNGSHSRSSGTRIARWNAAICAGDSIPAWLSLCPASGSRYPLIVYARKQRGRSSRTARNASRSDSRSCPARFVISACSASSSSSSTIARAFGSASSRPSVSRHAGPPLNVSAEYTEFGQSSIHVRSAGPPGRRYTSWRRLPYLRTATSKPVVRATSSMRLKRRSVTTLSRLCRL